MTDLRARLEALAAQPRNWRVTTHYAGGASKSYAAVNEAGANNYAIGERRKIGRYLISRETGERVLVTGVTIAQIQ